MVSRAPTADFPVSPYATCPRTDLLGWRRAVNPLASSFDSAATDGGAFNRSIAALLTVAQLSHLRANRGSLTSRPRWKSLGSPFSTNWPLASVTAAKRKRDHCNSRWSVVKRLFRG